MRTVGIPQSFLMPWKRTFSLPAIMFGLIILSYLTLVTSTDLPYDSSWYGTTPHPSTHPYFRSVTDFGAKGDGISDDTLSIQAAINHNRGAHHALSPAIVYFPPGEYLVSDTIITYMYTELRGCSTIRPTLRLAPSSPGFQNTSALRPVIASNAGYDRNLSVPFEWWDNSLMSNYMFYMHIHQINVDRGPGNPGAVGIYWCVAQQTSLRDLSIAVGGGYSGIDICQIPNYDPQPGGGSGGGGTIEDISISGGEYAVRGMASQWTFRGLDFTNQNTATLFLVGFLWLFAFVDVRAAHTPLFLGTSELGDRHSTSISLIDVTLTNITGPSAIILDRAGVPLFLQNLTLIGGGGSPLPSFLVANTSLPFPEGTLTPWLTTPPLPPPPPHQPSTWSVGLGGTVGVTMSLGTLLVG